MPVDHYENFPVASLLLPKRLRRPVEVIYAFARSADDLADEGDASVPQRMAALASYEAAIEGIANGSPQDSRIFRDLASVVHDSRLPLQPMRDLLSAFRQDVVTDRYPTFEMLLDYCRRSADPIGQLMLHLYGAADERNLNDSSSICSALQLINFWQDVAVDWKKSRIYLPQEDMQHFRVDENHIALGTVDDAWRALMGFEVDRARSMLVSGSGLAFRLPGRIGWELRLIVQGGLRILDRIEAADFDVFRRRPQLKRLDWACIGSRALLMKIRLSAMAQVG